MIIKHVANIGTAMVIVGVLWVFLYFVVYKWGIQHYRAVLAKRREYDNKISDIQRHDATMRRGKKR